MAKVEVDATRVEALVNLLSNTQVPSEDESTTHEFVRSGSVEDLANCYLAIVAICHQTSPIGERRLEGYVGHSRKAGWDYLKEKYLLAAACNPILASPAHWANLTPFMLAELYSDDEFGFTMNRVNERTFLLNDLGRGMIKSHTAYIREAFDRANRMIDGDKGFLKLLSQFEAYRDPLGKKAYFFLSLAINECQWAAADPENLKSPIDYHELRGHLRIGTIIATDMLLSQKVRLGLLLTEEEDLELRRAAQHVNEKISEKTGLSSSVIHYLLWNVFRNCCPRQSDHTHCKYCLPTCALPERYKQSELYEGRCIFAPVCDSASKPEKVADPPYVGHYH